MRHSGAALLGLLLAACASRAAMREQPPAAPPRSVEPTGASVEWPERLLVGATEEPEDRATLRELALRTHLEWASEHLECTSYWNRSDGCRGAALDHVFRRERPRSVDARGPCESIGCSPGDRCPAFHREVSDHCPVTIDL